MFLNPLSITDHNLDINENLFSEYVNFHNLDNSKSYTKNEVLLIEKSLFDKRASKNIKQKILFRLAHTSDVEAYKLLKKFYEQATGFLKEWTALCLDECQVFVESDLLEIPRGMISTGLGGDGKRLRYYVILTKIQNTDFNKEQKNRLEGILEIVVNKYDAKIQEIEFNKGIAVLAILIPINVAPGSLIIKMINNCNQSKRFLKFHYFITNVGKPKKKEIKDYLKFLGKNY